MNNERGFTLVEMLLVLALKTLLIILILPTAYSHLSQTKIDVFFDELKADIEYIQIENYQTNNANVLYFHKNNYTIIKNSTQQLIKRKDYPKDVTIDKRILDKIIYQKNGTLQKPGHIIFKQGKMKYKLIFPLGKGGFYIDREE